MPRGLSSKEKTFDYIVVGGGSAGCVIAARLSEDDSVSVLLLEAGPQDKHIYFRAPAGFAKMLDDRATWGWHTTPQSHVGNTSYLYPQGRVLGGGSSINAQVYTRGNARDYDAWVRECGCPGWGYEELLPYFLRAENNDTFSNRFHGVDGPLHVSQPVNPLPISRAFIRAAQEAGIPFNADFNGERQNGFGLYQTTIGNGERSSTSQAYLKPNKDRKNLTVITGAIVKRLVMSGRQVVGVEYLGKGSTGFDIVNAANEVILTSGAIGSPRLLLLSGIGPSNELRALGIQPQIDLEGVGKNLQDHFDLYVIAECSGDFTYDKHGGLLKMAASGLQYLALRNGPAASNLVEAGGFASTTGESDWPDIQFHVVLGSGINYSEDRLRNCGVTLNTAMMRPRSAGSVTLASDDLNAAPLIDPNFLADPDDRKRSVAGFRLAREILAQSSLAPFIKREVLPGTSIETDTEILREAGRFSKTDYHPVGTCKMGIDDLAVTDPRTLKVHGTENLRICDSSVMPRIISSNTNAATIAVAERAVEFIAADK